MHITVPLKADKTFVEVQEFAKQAANYICDYNPKEFTTTIRKNKRKVRLYVDFLRNSYAQTSVVPFSIRAIENAPVGTPLSWNELDDSKLNAQTYTTHRIFKRMETKHNPWEDFEQNGKSIVNVLKKLESPKD